MSEVIEHVWPFIVFMYGLLLVCMFVPPLRHLVPAHARAI